MAASFSTLPFRLIPVSSSSHCKQQQHQQLVAISSSFRSSISTRLPTASSAFGFPSPSPVTRLKFQPVNSTPDEALAAVETLEEGEEGGEEDVKTENAEGGEEEATPLRPPIVKLGDIMGILNKRAVEVAEQERPVPDLRTGDIVQIKLEVPENRRRASIYKGIVISKQNAGIHTTIRIRRIIAGIGVEIVFPVYSPNIKEIKVVSHRKVRRARLYYLRDKLPRLSTFK